MTQAHNSRPPEAAPILDANYTWNLHTNVGQIWVFDGQEWHEVIINSTQEFVAILQVIKSREAWYLNGKLGGSL